MPESRAYFESTIARAGLAVLALGLVITPASAGTCLEQIERLAQAYDLSTEPPALAEGQDPDTITPEELGQSGGVIEPPPVSDSAVIEPPDDLHYAMPTVPSLESEIQPGDARLDSNSLNASERVVLETTLMAARAEAERGQESDCFERLRLAQRLVQHQDE